MERSERLTKTGAQAFPWSLLATVKLLALPASNLMTVRLALPLSS